MAGWISFWGLCGGSRTKADGCGLCQGSLYEAQLGDGVAAQIGIDSSAYGPAFMLEEQASRGFCAQGEEPALCAFGEFDRPGNARNLRPDNFGPAQNQGGIAKAFALHREGNGIARIIGNRARTAAPPGWLAIFAGLFVLAALGHRRYAVFSMKSMQAMGVRAQKQKMDEPAARLLAWYDVHRRSLPWRAPAGKRMPAYRVWLSEIMLQQTTVAAVGAYYRKFVKRWPTVKDLADAPLDDVLAAWAGLGYYARARNLHAAAKIVAYEMGGKFPCTAAELRVLPGIGTYTSGAVAAIAFDECEAAMDANADRVVARYYALCEPLPKIKPRLRTFGQALVPQSRAGDFVQALMDLGAAICTPKRPNCANCPWTEDCAARIQNIQETLPMKGAKMLRPLRRGVAFVAHDRTGAVLLVKRPEKGLLGGMAEPPMGPWVAEFPSTAEAMKLAPFKAVWKKRAGIVRHGFTHFELEIEVYVALIAKRPQTDGKWVKDLANAALPTLMRKIIEHGLDEGGPLFTRPKFQDKSARKR